MNLIFVLLFFGGVHSVQQTKPAARNLPTDAPPALSYSQNSSIFFLEGERHQIEPQREALRLQLNDIDLRWASVIEAEKAIAAEYAQQHPGWRLDDKFEPIRAANPPARRAQDTKQ